MTVGELLGILQRVPADTPVILGKDAEGNGFSPLNDVEQGFYEAESTYHGEFVRTTPYPLGPEVVLALLLNPVN